MGIFEKQILLVVVCPESNVSVDHVKDGEESNYTMKVY